MDVECLVLFPSFRLQIFALNSAYEELIISQKVESKGSKPF